MQRVISCILSSLELLATAAKLKSLIAVARGQQPVGLQ